MDFSNYLAKYKDRMFTRDGVQLLPVAVQLIIFREYAADNKLGFFIRPAKVDISPFAHHVSITAGYRSLESGKISAMATGCSTRYAWEYTAMARLAATENADTIATGRALAKLGISPQGTTRTLEEHEAWEQAQSNEQAEMIEKCALLFTRLPIEVKYQAKILKLSIADIPKLVPNPEGETALTELTELITSGRAAEVMAQHAD